MGGFFVVMGVLGIAYLLWVALAWGFLTVIAAFGVTIGISAWALAIPLMLTTTIVRGVLGK